MGPLASQRGVSLQVEGWLNGKQHFRKFSDKNGAVRTISAGTGSALRYTNVQSGATLSSKSNGSVTHTTYNVDGSKTLELTGHNVVFMFPTDTPPGPSTTLYAGRVVILVDLANNFTVQQASGSTFAYSVAKGAVVHLSRVAAALLAKDAIRVNAICPGLIPTSIFGRAMGDSIADADRRARDISELAHGFQPIRVAGSPEDIGNAVAYFASDLSRFVTGQFLAVDGGLTVGPRQAWDEPAAIESWTRIGMSEDAVKKLLGRAG